MKKIIDLRPRKVIPKIGFVLQDPVVLHHYTSVLEQFEPQEVELVLHQSQRYPELAQYAARFRFRSRQSADLLRQRQGYALLVSNHYIGLLDPIPYVGYPPRAAASLIRLLGQINVRFMYGLGAESWNLSDWNGYYDHFLCQGPRQAQALESFPGKTWLMGYPRYDPYFNQSFDRSQYLHDLGLSADKPVVLYLPTLKAYGGTLYSHAHKLIVGSDNMHLLIKPHPLARENEPEDFEQLAPKLGSALLQKNWDNLDLLRLADYVLCDCGGSPFSALYLDKNLLLLQESGYDCGETEHYLQQFIPALQEHEIESLPRLLKNPKHWQEQAKIRQQLRQEFFAPYQGQSSTRAATLLRQWFAEAQALSP